VTTIASARTWSLLGSARNLSRISIVEITNTCRPRTSIEPEAALQMYSEGRMRKHRAPPPQPPHPPPPTPPTHPLPPTPWFEVATISAIHVSAATATDRISPGFFSSIIDMVTGLAFFTEGSMRWKVSKVLTRKSWTGAGSASERRKPRTGARGTPAAPSRTCARPSVISSVASCWLTRPRSGDHVRG